MIEYFLSEIIKEKNIVELLYSPKLYCILKTKKFFYSYVALSNTNGVKKRWNERLTIWKFERTQPIPTYLFAISVGQFSYDLNHLIISNYCLGFFRSIGRE